MTKLVAVLLWVPILIWVAVAYLVRLIKPPSPATFEPGVTFSASQAETLGLVWEETFSALLADLGVKRFRIPVYWTEVEAERGMFNFARLDWSMREIEAHNAKVILALGQKLPRWPECHVPQWARGIPNDELENALLNYIEAVVSRYKSSPAVEAWQVENEPFFKFGICPDITSERLSKEIELVRSLDTRPIVVTDSGELGTWFDAARLGDIVGTTMYRRTWKAGFGYLRYFLPAGFYEKKARLIQILFGDPVIISEMQLEPWVPSPPLTNASLEEQFRTMNFDKFRDAIAFSRASRIPRVYFWGAEWWYWMKLNGHPEFWDYLKTMVFK